MGHEVDCVGGIPVCFIEDEMPRHPGWLSAKNALLWTRKHLYYKKLGMPFRVVRSIGDFMRIPYQKFWFKPSVSHCIDTKLKRAWVTDRMGFAVSSDILWERHDTYVAQEAMPSDEQVWAMTLWDSSGEGKVLWYSTEKIHATDHPMMEEIDRSAIEVGKKLGLRRWMAFMEFCVTPQGVSFLDLNARLPGDDDWHEFVYRHICGRGLGLDIAIMMTRDRLPPRVRSDNIVLEAEWDGSPVASNQKVWDYSDCYKEKPMLTFTKKGVDTKIGR